MSDIWTDMSPLWCDAQVIHVDDIQMNCLRRRYNGQMVDVTDIQMDMSCWWYDRRMVDATDIQMDTSCGWYDRRGSRMFQLNNACDATPPQSTLVEVLV